MCKNSAKILIVEDEPEINRLIEMVLLSGGFYNIKKAYDGFEAFKMLKSDKPDLVITDIMLPKSDGLELCKKIKKDEFLKDIRVIMLTAKKLEEDVLNGFEAGAVDYISKPFSNKILLARVKAHLNNIAPKTLMYKGLEIDDLRKTVILEGREIDLTKFEFEILKILMTSAGIVFSRAKLLSLLRGDDGFNISERAVDVQILNLRRKLGDFASNIETIRGAGYKFKELKNEKER